MPASTFPRPGTLVRIADIRGRPLPAIVVGRLGRTPLLVVVTPYGRSIVALRDVLEEVL